MGQGLQDTWGKVSKAYTLKKSQGGLIGVPVPWQFRQILESFDTGSIIQGEPMYIGYKPSKKCIYEEILPPEYKNV